MFYFYIFIFRLTEDWINKKYQQSHSSQATAFLEFLKRLRVIVKRKSEEGIDLCAFCRNNGEPFGVYVTHKVRNFYCMNYKISPLPPV